jgi:hypothetical protein
MESGDNLLDASDTKFSFSNAKDSTPIEMATSHCNGVSGYVIFASPQKKSCSRAPMLTLRDSVEILKIVMQKKEAFL